MGAPVSPGPPGAESAAGPPVVVVAPDGARVPARLASWVQAADSRWWARLHTPLWGREDAPDGRSRPAPAEVEWWAPADHVQPVAGADYRQVPRGRHRRAVARSARRDLRMTPAEIPF